MKKILLIITTAFLLSGVVFCQKDCDPIEGLKATFVEDTKTVFLEWEAPTKKLSLSKSIQNEETDNHDSANKADGWIGWCGPFDRIFQDYSIFVVRFSIEDLAALGVVPGYEVTKVRFVPGYSAAYNYGIHIYKSYNYDIHQLMYAQPIAEILKDSVYNDIILDTPYKITDDNYEFGFSVGVKGRNIGMDSGPRVNGKGNIYFMEYGWWLYPYANWNIEVFAREPNQKFSYNIYRNDSLIASNLEEMYYIDDVTGLNSENYEYCVVAVTSTCESERVCQTLSINSINEYSPILTIYPNPTTGELTISPAGWGKGVEQLTIDNVEVFDIYGKCHLSLVTCHTSLVTLNISHLSAGLYFVKISTEAGMVVKKVVRQ